MTALPASRRVWRLSVAALAVLVIVVCVVNLVVAAWTGAPP